jgi:hypothetical protein
MAILESGTQQLSQTAVYNFFPTQSVTTDSQGGFSLCAPSIPYPSVLVLEAMDSSGNAYPPFVIQASTGNYGVFNMGPETAQSATITGTVTSSPIALTGTLIPQFTVNALDLSKAPDGSYNTWALALPMFNASPSLTFSTLPGTCGGTAQFCSTFNMPVSVQTPIENLKLGIGYVVTPSVMPATYLIYAAPASSACTPVFGTTLLQSDGKSPLAATPGAQLTAQTISFTNCH